MNLIEKQAPKGFFIAHLLFLLSLIVVYFIPRVCSLPEIGILPPSGRYVRFYIIAVFSLVFIFYYLYLYFHSKGGAALFNMNARSVYFWSTTFAVFLFLCSSWAVLSTDLYEYSMRGRMFSLYGMNPYVHVPAEAARDMFYPFLFWKYTPECYGPAWVLIGALHTLFFKGSMAWTMFLHKAVLLLFLVFSGYFFYRLCIELKLDNAKVLALAFFTNPLVVIMSIVDGHNEIAMVCFMLASLYFLCRSRYIPGLVLFAVAVQVKFVYILLAPLVLLYILFGPGGKEVKARIRGMVFGGVLSAGVVALLWSPFGWRSVVAIFDYYKALGNNFWPDSIPYVVFFVLRQFGATVSTDMIAHIFSGIFLAIYVCVVYSFLKNVRYDRQALFTAATFIILALLFTNPSPFQAWYLLWVIPLILLSRIRAKFMLTFFISYFLIMTFWKRMSALAIPMIVLYLAVLSVYDRYEKRLKFFAALER